MIKGSISWFVDCKEDVEFIKDFVESYKKNVQLSFYERKDVDNWAAHLLDIPKEYITSIHLPKGLVLKDYSEGGLVDELKDMFDVSLFVVHSWAEDLVSIVDLVLANGSYCLCLEVFPSKKNAKGNLFTLLSRFGQKCLESENIGLCVDFSHLLSGFCNYDVIRELLPYTKMIHASCRLGKNRHLPVFKRSEDINPINLIGQILRVKDLKVQEIVLEYMKGYRRELVKHIFWLDDWILRKRKRWGNKKERENAGYL